MCRLKEQAKAAAKDVAEAEALAADSMDTHAEVIRKQAAAAEAQQAAEEAEAAAVAAEAEAKAVVDKQQAAAAAAAGPDGEAAGAGAAVGAAAAPSGLPNLGAMVNAVRPWLEGAYQKLVK
jgi:colicin import membrane protein